jgi:ribose 1,5-bisphosphokinase PhnN
MTNVLKTPFFILSGPSGIGKTTTLRAIERLTAREKRTFVVPNKVTTRPLKPSDDPKEQMSVTQAQFEELHSNGHLMLGYERHGNRYGLLNTESASIPADSVFIQAIPARLAEELKRKHSDKFHFIVLRLEAPTEIVVARAEGRRDIISASEKESRRKTIFSDVSESVDHFIDADRDSQAVARAVMEISRRYSRAIKSNFITAPERDLLSHLGDTCRQYPFALFGGLSAYAYGATRIPTDIDVIIRAPNVNAIASHLARFEPIVEPNKISCGRIDIRLSPVRIGDKALGQVWCFDDEAVSRAKPLHFADLDLKVVSPEDVFAMKAALQRGTNIGKFDVEDAREIVANNRHSLDWEYIHKTAKKCNMSERIEILAQKLRHELDQSVLSTHQSSPRHTQ